MAKVIAHRRPSLRARKYSSRVSRAGALRSTIRGAGADGNTACTSTLPMVTCTAGAAVLETCGAGLNSTAGSAKIRSVIFVSVVDSAAFDSNAVLPGDHRSTTGAGSRTADSDALGATAGTVNSSWISTALRSGEAVPSWLEAGRLPRSRVWTGGELSLTSGCPKFEFGLDCTAFVLADLIVVVPSSGRETASEIAALCEAANTGAKSGFTSGATPRVFSASRKKNRPSAYLFEIKLPARRAHRQDIRLAPSIGPREGVHFVETTSRRSGDFGPQKRRDIERQLPDVTAGDALQVEHRVGLAFADGKMSAESLDAVGGQVAHGDAFTVLFRLDHTAFQQNLARALDIPTVGGGLKVRAIERAQTQANIAGNQLGGRSVYRGSSGDF